MRRTILLASTVLAALTLGAPAQETDRYSLEKSRDGFVRLDRRTGEVSTCQDRSGQLVCRVAADERTALQDEMDRLRSTLTDIERRLVALEGAGGSELPSEGEFEKTIGYMERFFRGFMGIVREFRNEFGDPEAAPDDPQRT